MKTLFKIISVIILLTMLLSACTPAPAPAPAAPAAPAATTAPAAPAAGKKPVIGLVMKSLANQYFKDMQDGAQKWADANNVDLKPVGIQNETDVDAQIAAIENLITQKVDIIIIAPANSVALAPVAKKAVDAGITVVNMDVAFDPKALADNGLTGLPYVGPDNRIGSKLAGDALAKSLGKGGKVLILEGVSGADNATQRTNGFKDAVKEGGLTLIDSVNADWETEKANTVTTNELTAHPDIQGIMCDNDSMVLGAVKAVEAAGKTGKIQIVGFDNIAPVQDLIKKGTVLATVDQFSTVQAVDAMQVGLRMLKGEKLTGWVKTDVKLITVAELGAAPAAAAGKKPVIGLVMKSLANQYFKDMQDGAQKWADANNVDLKPVGIQNETDVDAQIAAIENLITQKVDIIIIAPANSVALAPVAKKAVDAGITVVNMDVAFDPKALADNGLTGLPYVGPDNRIGSKLAGDALAKSLGKGGKVLILEDVSGADNATQRTNGFKDAVKEGGLTLIDSVNADWETEKANTVTTNELTAHPDIQGIMCDNDSMVLGAVKAVEAAGKLGKIQIVGFDNIAPVQDLIKKGNVLATVDQFSTVQAVDAMQVGLRMLKGEKLTGWVKTDVKLITVAELGAAPAAAAGKKPVIGLVMKSLANQYFKDMQDGAQKWADANNVDLKPVGIQNETDVDAQIAAIENLITQKVDIIIIAPANSVALAPVAKKAVDAGITVVNMDVAFDPKALADNGLTGLPYVGPDNRIGSKLAGDALAKKLGKGGKVLILEGVSGADNATQRTNGFKDAVKEGGLTLIDSVNADWETEKANTVTTNELTAHPDIQGIMCDNDSMVLGAVKAVEAAGKLGQIQIVGFDNIAPVQDLIKKGNVLATVDQFSTVQAVDAMQVGLRMLKGEKLTGWVKTDVKLITAAELK